MPEIIKTYRKIIILILIIIGITGCCEDHKKYGMMQYQRYRKNLKIAKEMQPAIDFLA